MIAWVVKADRETLDDIATLFCRAGRRVPSSAKRPRTSPLAANTRVVAISTWAIKAKLIGHEKRYTLIRLYVSNGKHE